MRVSFLCAAGLAVLLAWSRVPAVAQTSATCENVRVNAQNHGAAVLVTETPTPIVKADPTRCALIIINETSQLVRCAPTSGRYPLTVSATVGLLLKADLYPFFGSSGRQAWACVRTGTYDARLTILEEVP